MKKILRKELNRTVLAKEGTKWMYLTAKEFLPFFGTTQEVLSENKKDIKAYIKDDFLDYENPEEFCLQLTKANKETRLFGRDFPSLYERLGVCECDVLLIENAMKNGEEVYLFSASKSKNIILKKYSRKDIQKDEKLRAEYTEYWWAWDNHLTDDEMMLFFNSEHTVKFINNNITSERKIKFQKKTDFLKYMNQASGSIKKSLYSILELKNDIWTKADFGNIDTLQFESIDGVCQLTPKKSSVCTYQEFE